jgi:hypothetical protein
MPWAIHFLRFPSETCVRPARAEFHRTGPNRATWHGFLTENQRPELGPRFGPTLRLHHWPFTHNPGGGAPPVHSQGPRRGLTPAHTAAQGALRLGFGRVFASEIEIPNLSVNLV